MPRYSQIADLEFWQFHGRLDEFCKNTNVYSYKNIFN